MKWPTCIVMLTLLFPTPVRSQEIWSLEACIQYAAEHNLQVRQAQLNVLSGEIDNRQAKLNYLPNLSAGVGYNASFGRSLDPTTYEYISGQSVNNVNTSLSLSTQVFAGMQKMHVLRRSELNLLASVQERERIRDEITLAVTAAYLQILYNNEQIAVSEGQIATLTEQIERTARLVEAGSVALGNQLELEAQLASEQYNLVNYRNVRTNALLDLTQLLELRDVPEFDVETPPAGILDELLDNATAVRRSVEDIFAAALELPQVEVQRLRRDVAREDISIARSRYYPTLSFGASYGSSWSDARMRPQLMPDGTVNYGDYPFFDQLSDNASSALQFNLSIPIFTGLTVRNNVRQSELALRSADLSLLQTENRLYKDIQQAWTDVEGALERYRFAQSSVRSSEEAFRYAEQRFNAGALTSVDYNIALNNLTTAQSMLVQAKYDYIFKTKILDFYRREPITL